MKRHARWILLGLLSLNAGAARGELLMVPASEPARVFTGPARTFPVTWQNSGADTVTAEVQLHLLQATSATVILLGDSTWKKLQVLPGQTILESASLDFPEVKAETRFIIRWMEGTNRVFGVTDVLVYPTNLLAELKTLAGESHRLGVFDPENVLKPLLKNVAVEFEDLQDSGVADFRGKLAVIGPFRTRAAMPGDMGERIGKLARKGTVVVWLQPPPERKAKLQPSFTTVPVDAGTVVVAQPQLTAHLDSDPQSQLNLLHFCRTALNPEPARLPASQP
jgi:hypothetical protein